ncbi:MAG TPA: phosphatase PAP2 family protein [Vicinamibacterales bacterium]|nr:phosphatase PAP2 family protein [Vicinamibacterales bacterium]
MTAIHLRRIVAALALAASLFLCPAPAAAQSIASLFTSLPADFAHLFTPANGAIVGAGGAGSLALHPQDDEIAADIYQPSGGRHDFFRAGATIGDGVEQNAFALGTYVVGRVWRRAGVASTGADLIDAQIVNAVLTQGIKAATHRTRPNGGRRSFPSGHTSASFATAEVIREHYGWRWGAPLYALGAYVSVSRMVDNKHWASDVIFGTAIGIVSGRAASFGHGPQRVSVAPSILPGGFGIAGSIRRWGRPEGRPLRLHRPRRSNR